MRILTTKHGKLDQFPEPEVIKHLPGGHIFSAQDDTSSSNYDSINNVPNLDIEAGRWYISIHLSLNALAVGPIVFVLYLISYLLSLIQNM